MLKFQKEDENPKGLKMLSLNNLFHYSCFFIKPAVANPQGYFSHGALFVFL